MTYGEFKRQQGTDFDTLQRAYDAAPRAGKWRGAGMAVPIGLAAGALTYGGLSLIPALRRRRKSKLALGLLTALGGGYLAYKHYWPKYRDAYFTQQTGLPTPWKEYTIDELKGMKINPSETYEQLKKEAPDIASRPFGRLKDKFVNELKRTRSKDVAYMQQVKNELNGIKQDPVGKLKMEFNQAYNNLR